jgi:type II secretory pathway component PulF
MVPTIVVLMTVLIGAIILSVLLPIYDLTGSLG